MMLHQYSSLLVRGCFSCCKNVSIASSILTKAISTSCHLSIRGSRLGKGELPEDYDPRSIDLKDLVHNAADATVPPGPEGQNVTLWDQYSYPESHKNNRDQMAHSHRPNTVDPSETSIILFPGQGTQYIGMCRELLHMPIVRQMFDAASSILEFDLAETCLKGPKQLLSQTQVQQPALFVASLAAVEKLREERPHVLENCVATAGFSVGEITALTFAGAFSFEEALELIKVRSEAMQIASDLSPGGMMTAFVRADTRLGFACSVAKEYCQKIGVQGADCRIASFLHPTCKVVAGSEEALLFLEKNMAEFKIKKLKRLNVSGAFHTDLMKPAVEPFKEALKHMTIHKPLISVHSNVTGKIYANPNHILRQLPKQIHSPVRWEQTLHILYDRDAKTEYPNTFECGPGKSLKAILKMVNQKASDTTLNVEA